MTDNHRHPIVVVHTPAGGGHRAAANAIAEAARRSGFDSIVVDALSLAPPWFRQAYVSAHLGSSAWLPTLYGGVYFASNQRVEVSEELRRRFDRAVGAALLNAVRSLRPAAVVATHFYPLTVFGDARQRGELDAPVIGVVTDYAAHAIWADPYADAMCAPPGRAIDDLVRHGVRAERVFPTGIAVSPAFASIRDAAPPGPQDALRVLLTSGGFGVGPLLDTMRSFTGMPDMQLTVVCGDNPELLRRARRLAARRALDADVLGFAQDMPARIADAHVVVGKPGGLTTTECLVARRPMVVVGAAGGQEMLNARWLVQNGFARTAPPCRVGPMLAVLRRAGALAAMADRGRFLAPPDAAVQVVRVALTVAQSRRRAAA